MEQQNRDPMNVRSHFPNQEVDEIVALYLHAFDESDVLTEALKEAEIPYVEHRILDDETPLPMLAIRSITRAMRVNYRGEAAILFDFIPVYQAATEKLAVAQSVQTSST